MFGHYINGKIVEGKEKPFDVICPATDEVLETLNAADLSQTQQALEAAQEAFKTWSRLTINQRNSWIIRLTEAFYEESDTLCDLLAKETGLSYVEAKKEVTNGLNDIIRFYCEEVKRVYGTMIPDQVTKPGEVYHIIQYDPVGVTVGHIPWNHPITLAANKIGAALATGCTCIIKPSSSTPLATLYLGVIAEKINFPKGVLNIIAGPSSVVGKALNESDIPRLIGVIGSTETGREVVSQSATSIKHYSFELGGNAPCIIMPDADFEDAVKYIISRKVFACGQGCSNINRIYIHKDVHDEVVNLLYDEISKVKVGWGKDVGDAMGPQVKKDHRDYLLELIKDAVDKGAKVVYGGKIPDGMTKGNFIMPTLLDNMQDNMRITHEEVFGPIFPIYSFEDLDEAIERSNNTYYGLSAYVYSHDARVIFKCSQELQFGMVYINNPTIATPYLPHVGIKESGVFCDRSKWSLDPYYYMRRISIRP
jgi:succinate-semialdehyde dehydrogenase/glutarate-semialdehyde dehydrogenase